MKKTFLILSLLLFTLTLAQAILPAETSLPTPAPTICPCLMNFGFEPYKMTVPPQSDFQLDLNFAGNTDRLGAYGFTFTYDPQMIAPGEDAVLAGDQGFLTIYNSEDSGVIKVAGFDTSGIGDPDGNFLKLNFTSLDRVGETSLTLEIDDLTDVSSYDVMVSTKSVAILNIGTDCLNKLGDVNSDNFVNIVDALLIARYYVGEASNRITECSADVNNDGKVTIVDALLIAQYYVGQINQFN